jgi:hypothetical protein
MRLHEAKKLIEGKPSNEDVAERFGARKGTLTVSELRKMMIGHEDHESVQPNQNGEGVWITDWTNNKTFVMHKVHGEPVANSAKKGDVVSALGLAGKWEVVRFEDNQVVIKLLGTSKETGGPESVGHFEKVLPSTLTVIEKDGDQNVQSGPR